MAYTVSALEKWCIIPHKKELMKTILFKKKKQLRKKQEIPENPALAHWKRRKTDTRTKETTWPE